MITITVDGRKYQREPLAGELDGIRAARERVMLDLPPGPGQAPDTPPQDRPGYISDDVAYLESTVAEWAARMRADEAAIAACMERCMRSWARVYR